MSTRARTSGTTAIQYEDFQPKSERKQEEGAEILLLHLPGFLKEQIKITYVHSSRIIRVVGERPVSYNKWSRFNQAFPVPQDCEVSKIQAKFQNGVLSITLPMAVTAISFGRKEDKITQEAPIPQQPPTRTGKEESEPKTQKQVSDKKVESVGPQEGLKESKPLKAQEQVPPVDSKERKDITKSVTPDSTTIAERTTETKDKTISATEETSEEEKESNKKRKESMESPSSSKKRKDAEVDGEAVSEKNLKEKGENEYRKVGEESGEIAEKVKDVKTMAAAAKKKVMAFTSDLKVEDRQSMVNMGIAVLVIAAVGAYVYYRYRSSTSANE